jgi:cardiolipin synthase A/B
MSEQQKKHVHHLRDPKRPVRGRAKGRPNLWTVARRILWTWWCWTFVAIWGAGSGSRGWAIGGAIMAFFTYLIAPTEEPPQYGLDHEFPIDSQEFLNSVVAATGVTFLKGNRMQIFNNGDEFYPAMLEAIKEARFSITIEAFIYWEGEIGQRFATALSEKSRHGVMVKILLDAVGSSSIGRNILQTLESGGCQVEWYNPVFWFTVGRFNNRTHRKSLIIDGRLAFTGGAGIADHWLGNAEDPKHWRDIQVCIDGPGAMPLQTGFCRNWLETTGELITGELFHPQVDPVGEIAIQTILSSPETGSSTVRIMYYLSIVCARRSIYIANPYFIPDTVATDILIEAHKRGVDVKIMVAGIHNDMRVARYSSIELYGTFLKAGIEIYEYNRTMLHQKTMVVDGIWATVGTTNFDNRSFALNEESNICVFDSRLARQLEHVFLTDLDACDRVDQEKWSRRGLLTKARGALALLLKEQI